MIRYMLFWLGLVGMLSGMSGCSFSKPFPEKSFYRLYPLEVSEPAQPQRSGEVISLQGFSASEEFDGKGFVYRLGGQKFEVDFYNEWLTQPRVAVTDWFRRALVEDGHFSAVVDSTSRIKADIQLEGRILEWFVDFSERSSPAVVVALEIRCLRTGKEDSGFMGTKIYRKQTQPVSSDPAALVEAWQKAMESIVASFLADLKSSHR